MTNDAMKRLATAVSLAARIEPELLRAARLRLFPDMDVSAEGDLWFSDLVASRSARRIVLDPKIASSLRQSLKNNPPLLDLARAVVEEIHRNAPPAIQLEEKIIYLALSGENVENDINTMLTSVLNAIANEGRRGLIDWAARALPGMPAIVQNTTAAAALRLVAGGQTSDAVHVSRDPAIATLVNRAVPKTKVFARLVPERDGLSIELSRTELPASHEIEIPKTEPLVLELTTLGHTEVVDVPREGTLLRETDGAVSVRTIAQDVFRLEESHEEERTTVRILVMSGLSADQLAVPDEPNIDLVLIAGASDRGTEEEYVWIADRLRERFEDTPIFAVPGHADPDYLAFIAFLGRTGFTTDQLNFAKTVQIGTRRIGVVGIDTSFDEFHGLQITNLSNGDPLAWARAHDVAILLTYDDPEDLDMESVERWNAFGTGEVFDFIATGSRKTPDLADGYVVVEFPDRDGDAIVTTHTRGKDQIRRQAIHPRMDAMPPAQPRRVLVAGIAEGVPVVLQELCRAIGSLLALQGHNLLTGGWPGVDYLVAEGFDKAAPNRVESIAHYFGGLRKQSDYKRGRSVLFELEDDALSRVVRDADVVILIEGSDGTRSVGVEAMSQGKPVIPLGGAAAAQLRDDAIHPERWAEDTIERLRRLGGQASIATIVHDVNELIRVAHPLEDKSSPVQNVANAWEYDLFVSYSPADDRTKWVQSFVEMLQSQVQQILGRKVNFFFDLQFRTGMDVSDELVESLHASRILLVILSPSYLESDWCRKELQEFLSHSTTTVPNLFVVEAESVPREEWPQELRRLSTHVMWDSSGTTPLRLDPKFGDEFRMRFTRRAYEIGYLIAKRLQEFGGAAALSEDKPAVYLAECARDRRAARAVIQAELTRLGYTILPDRELPREETAFVAEVERLLPKCTLSIHLVGTGYGAVPDGMTEKSIVMLQNEIAVRASRSSGLKRIISLPTETRGANALQQEFIDRIHRDPDLQFGADLITGGIEELKMVILSALRDAERPVDSAAAQPAEKLVYLLCDARDRLAAVPLVKHLRDRGANTRLTLFTGDAVEVRNANEKLMMAADAIVLFYGSGDETWMYHQQNELRKVRGARRSKPPLTFTVLAAPASDDKEIIAATEKNVIDVRNGFSDDQLKPLEEALGLPT